MSPRAINHRQFAILQRLAAGDDLAAAANAVKLSAAALRSRGLVVVRRSPWRAALTDAGRFYIAHGRYPEAAELTVSTPPGRPRHELSTDTGCQGASADQRVATSAHRQPPHATARISAERRAAAIALLEELANVGEKVIEEPDDDARTYWRQVVDFAKRNQLVPAGKRIERSGAGWGDLCIRLLSGAHANSRRDTDRSAVPMPVDLRGLHPVVRTLDADSGRLHMAASLRRRCLLYLHGLTQEAVRRGFEVQAQPIAERHRGRITTYGRLGVPDYSRREGELNIVVEGFSYRLTIDQQHPEAADDERFDQLFVWVRGPGHPRGCRTRWRDGKRSRIDDSIAPVLSEIETWAAEAKRETDDRQARWQAAMDEATRMATQDRLVAELEDQVKHWRQIHDLRQYCDALEARIQDADEDEPVDEARRWLTWARDHAEIMDPLFQLPVTPTPKLRPDELELYLDGWSPGGPEVWVPRWRGLSRTPPDIV